MQAALARASIHSVRLLVVRRSSPSSPLPGLIQRTATCCMSPAAWMWRSSLVLARTSYCVYDGCSASEILVLQIGTKQKQGSRSPRPIAGVGCRRISPTIRAAAIATEAGMQGNRQTRSRRFCHHRRHSVIGRSRMPLTPHGTQRAGRGPATQPRSRSPRTWHTGRASH
jgi:hypothetical protein